MLVFSEDFNVGAVIEAVHRHGVKFGMAFQMPQDPVNQKMNELLDQGAVGPRIALPL